jgi:RNA polymerase sigma-70 factor (ECF subfamily)
VSARARLALVRPSFADDEGMRTAVNAFSGEMFGFALRALGDRGQAEDAVQETFVRAWRALRRFDPALGSQRTWLFAILRNVLIDASRRRTEQPVVIDGPEAAGAAIEDQIDGLLRSWVIEEALNRLTPEHRYAVVQVSYQGRAAVDLAVELDVPESTVRTRLFYGLKALRLALDELGWNDA